MTPLESIYDRGTTTTLPDGSQVMLRFIRGTDEAGLVHFHEALSPDSVYSRYFNVFKFSERIKASRLHKVCHPDEAHDLVLIAEGPAGDDAHAILGIGRLWWEKPGGTGEFALLIRDSHQKHGLGALLMRRLIELAIAKKITKLRAEVLADNTAMQRLCAHAGMTITNRFADGVVVASLDLPSVTSQ